jgi:uncharacterized protein YozE (UPF0346 family)
MKIKNFLSSINESNMKFGVASFDDKIFVEPIRFPKSAFDFVSISSFFEVSFAYRKQHQNFFVVRSGLRGKNKSNGVDKKMRAFRKKRINITFARKAFFMA